MSVHAMSMHATSVHAMSVHAMSVHAMSRARARVKHKRGPQSCCARSKEAAEEKIGAVVPCVQYSQRLIETGGMEVGGVISTGA